MSTVEEINPEGFAAFAAHAGEGVEYPTRQAFLDMVGSEKYRAIEHLRSEALLAGELHPLDGAS